MTPKIVKEDELVATVEYNSQTMRVKDIEGNELRKVTIDLSVTGDINEQFKEIPLEN